MIKMTITYPYAIEDNNELVYERVDKIDIHNGTIGFVAGGRSNDLAFDDSVTIFIEEAKDE